MSGGLRIAVVTPFLDKRHGTERVLAEQIERFVHQYGWEVHLFSQRVEDLMGVRRSGKVSPPARAASATKRASPPDHLGSVIWHRVPRLPGPHLVQFVWWYFANQLCRWWSRFVKGVRFDLVYSPGINCPDADAIAIHIVFHEFYRLVRNELSLKNNPWQAWPRLIHRRLYYQLIMALERKIYSNRRHALAAVSALAAGQALRVFGREDVLVIYNAVDLERFNPPARQKRRGEFRQQLGLADRDFVLLLVGNDWKKKGLDCLLEAAALCVRLPVRVLVVGSDARAPYLPAIERLCLRERVHFAESSPDVMQFYAAADAYVGPSLEDAFALPPAEAMACGLPVIISRQAGVSEWASDGQDALILSDPRDSKDLARLISTLVEDSSLCHWLGQKAAQTVQQYTWDRNAAATKAFLEDALARKLCSGARVGLGAASQR
jgi:glycosyltransferase involved in cell wall biosynthesis